MQAQTPVEGVGAPLAKGVVAGHFWPEARACADVLLLRDDGHVYAAYNMNCTGDNFVFSPSYVVRVNGAADLHALYAIDLDGDGADDLVTGTTKGVLVVRSKGGATGEFHSTLYSSNSGGSSMPRFHPLRILDATYMIMEAHSLVTCTSSGGGYFCEFTTDKRLGLHAPLSSAPDFRWEFRRSLAFFDASEADNNGVVDAPLAVADFDLDGRDDVLVSVCVDCAVSLMFNLPSSDFVSLGGQSPDAVAAGDFDGDGVPDAVLRIDTELILILAPPGTYLTQGTRTVADGEVLSASASLTSSLAVAQVTADGYTDLVLVDSGVLSVYTCTPLAFMSGPDELASGVSAFAFGRLMDWRDAHTLLTVDAESVFYSWVGSGLNSTSGESEVSTFAASPIVSGADCLNPSNLVALHADDEDPWVDILAVCHGSVLFVPGSQGGALDGEPVTVQVASAEIDASLFMDVNEDGIMDLVFLWQYQAGWQSAQPRLSYVLGAGGGAWGGAVSMSLLADTPVSLASIAAGPFDATPETTQFAVITCDAWGTASCVFAVYTVSLPTLSVQVAALTEPSVCGTQQCTVTALDIHGTGQKRLFVSSQEAGGNDILEYAVHDAPTGSVSLLPSRCPDAVCTGPLAHAHGRLWHRYDGHLAVDSHVFRTSLDDQVSAVLATVAIGFGDDAHTQSILYAGPSGVGVLDASTNATHAVAAGGFLLAATGDVDGDGFADLVVMGDEGGTSQPACYRRTPFPFQTPRLPAGTPVPGSPAELLRRLNRVSPCMAAVIDLPPGATMAGCPTEDHLLIPSDVDWTIRGDPSRPAVFDCSDGGGVLFRVGGSTSLTLEHVVIRGTTWGSASEATTGLRVDGSGALLRLRNVTLEGASTETVPTSRALAGVGGALLVTGGGRAALEGCVVRGNTAGTMGGGVAVHGIGSGMSAVASVFANNTALGLQTLDGAGGGGVAVSADAAEVSLAGVTMSGNSAVASGGAVFVRSNPGVSVVLRDVALVGNSASFGGAVAAMQADASGVSIVGASLLRDNAAQWGGCLSAVDPSSVLPQNYEAHASALPRAPVSASVPPPAITLGGSVRVSGCTAIYGGTVFACGVPVDARAASVNASAASRGGGVAYECVGADGGLRAAPAWAYLPAGAAGRAPYAPGVGSPPARAAVDGWPTHVVSGLPVGAGRVLFTDVFNATVVDTSLVVRVAVAEEAEAAIELTAPVLTVDETGSAAMASAIVSLLPGRVRGATVRSDPSLRVWAESIPAGWTASVETGVRVTLCPAHYGRVSDPDEPLQCALCTEGTFSETLDAEPCEVPPDCPANSLRATGAVALGLQPCLCEPGFFSRTGVSDVACDACPEGAHCAGGTDAPFALEGFFETGTHSFSRCLRGDACAGGPDSSCREGYDGYMCNDCVSGRYSDEDLSCSVCPKQGEWVVAGTAAALVVASLVLALPVALGLSKGAGAEQGAGFGSIERLRARTLPVSISMVAVAAQTIGLLTLPHFEWDSSSQSAINAFNAFNLDLSQLANECTLNSFAARFYASLLLPTLLLLLAIGWLVVGKAGNGCGCAPRAFSGLSMVSVWGLVDGALFSVAPLLYIPTARAALVVFDCRRLPNGTHVMAQRPGERCFDGAWSPLAVVGGFYVLGFCLGLPGYMLVVLQRARQSLLQADTFGRYGSLYRIYRRPYYWGGVADLARRLVLVVVATFLAPYTLVQIAAMLSLFVGSAFVTKVMRIHYFPIYDGITVRLAACAAVLCCLGAASYAERSREDGPPDAIFVCVVVMVCVFAVVALHAVLAEVREILQSRRGRYVASTVRAVKLARILRLERQDMDEEGLLADAVERAEAVLGGEPAGDSSATGTKGFFLRRDGAVQPSPSSSAPLSSALSSAALSSAPLSSPAVPSSDPADSSTDISTDVSSRLSSSASATSRCNSSSSSSSSSSSLSSSSSPASGATRWVGM